jgi:hypothetical protein
MPWAGVAENARPPLKPAHVFRAKSDARISHAPAQVGARLPKSRREPGAVLPAGSRNLNIPGMFAALLLLSPAGIGIYRPLALASHPALRRWHESALGKENGWLRVFHRKRLIC